MSPSTPNPNPPFVGEHRPSGSGWRGRILASILGPIAWLVFTLLYVGFWAGGFSLFQDVIVILVSILILGGVMGSVWTVWGTHHMGSWHD